MLWWGYIVKLLLFSLCGWLMSRPWFFVVGFGLVPLSLQLLFKCPSFLILHLGHSYSPCKAQSKCHLLYDALPDCHRQSGLARACASLGHSSTTALIARYRHCFFPSLPLLGDWRVSKAGIQLLTKDLERGVITGRTANPLRSSLSALHALYSALTHLILRTTGVGTTVIILILQSSSDSKESACNVGDPGSMPG